MAAPRLAAGAAATLVLWGAAVLAEETEVYGRDPDAVEAAWADVPVEIETQAPCQSSPTFEDEAGRTCADFDEDREPCPGEIAGNASQASTPGSACCACGGGSNRGARITGGYETDPVTSYVMCLRKTDEGKIKWGGCGAILIAPGYALTAAHCTKGVIRCTGGLLANAYYLPGLSEEVSFTNAGDNMGVKSHFSMVKSQVQHPEFWGKNKNDITLMRLQTPAPSGWQAIYSTPWFTRQLVRAEAMVITCGFGDTAYGTDIWQDRLLCVEMPLRSDEYCLKKDQRYSYNKMVCAGWPNGVKDSCYGDSGGPLYWRDSKGRYVLIGIVSYGLGGCGNPDTPGYYANIALNLDWVKANGATGVITTKDAGMIPPGHTRPETGIVSGNTQTGESPSPPPSTSLPKEVITGSVRAELMEAHRVLRCRHGATSTLSWSDDLAIKAKERLDSSAAKRAQVLAQGCSANKASSSLSNGRGGSGAGGGGSRCKVPTPKPYYYAYQSAGNNLFDAHWPSAGRAWKDIWDYYYQRAISVGTTHFGSGNPLGPASFAAFKAVKSKYDAVNRRFAYWTEVVVALAGSTGQVGCAEDNIGRVCVYRTSNLWAGVAGAVKPYNKNANCGARSDEDDQTEVSEESWGTTAGAAETDIFEDYWNLEADCTVGHNLPDESMGADTSDCALPMATNESCVVTCREKSDISMAYYCINGFFLSELGPHIECSDDAEEKDKDGNKGKDTGGVDGIGADPDLDLDDMYGKGVRPLPGGAWVALILAIAPFVLGAVNNGSG